VKCFEYVYEYADEVLLNEGFLSCLRHDDFQQILESDQLNSREVVIFRAIVRWGEIQLKPGEVLKETIDHLLKLVRLGRMSETEIESIVRPSELFDVDKVQEFRRLGVAQIDRPRIEGSMQFGMVNDISQARILEGGKGVLKTGGNEGIVALGQY
jgi:hypothetical protein